MEFGMKVFSAMMLRVVTQIMFENVDGADGK